MAKSETCVKVNCFHCRFLKTGFTKKRLFELFCFLIKKKEKSQYANPKPPNEAVFIKMCFYDLKNHFIFFVCFRLTVILKTGKYSCLLSSKGWIKVFCSLNNIDM